MHPILAELCRVNSIAGMRPDFFRRMQRELRDTIQPLLDERDKLITENAELLEELRRANQAMTKLEQRRAPKQTAVPA